MFWVSFAIAAGLLYAMILLTWLAGLSGENWTLRLFDTLAGAIAIALVQAYRSHRCAAPGQPPEQAP